MTDRDLVLHLKFLRLAAEFQARPDGARAEALDQAIEAVETIAEIRQIAARALRSSDPSNLSKAQALDQIGAILSQKEEDPDPEETGSGDQISFDELI